jgi:hypothetical protein
MKPRKFIDALGRCWGRGRRTLSVILAYQENEEFYNLFFEMVLETNIDE